MYFKIPEKEKPVWPKDGEHYTLTMLQMLDASNDFGIKVEQTVAATSSTGASTASPGSGAPSTSEEEDGGKKVEEGSGEEGTSKSSKEIVFKSSIFQDKSWTVINAVYNISTMIILKPVS